MKKIYYCCFVCLFIFANYTSGQSYFDNTWTAFNTGNYPDGRYPSAIRVADIDHDNDQDIVAAIGTFGSGFVVLKNQGGSYALPIAYASPNASNDIVVADLNADNLEDVVVSNTGYNGEGTSISVFFNQGNGIFGTALSLTVGNGPVGLAVGDFDGDADIAVCNKGSNTVSIVKNAGSGNFNAAVSFTAGNAPYKISASRINADNNIDLVIANEGEQKMNILFNDGTGNFNNRVEHNVLSVWGGDFWACIEVADMDNDGDNDILYSSTKTYDGNRGYIAYFKNNGDGTLAAVLSLPLSVNTGGATDIEIADLNGDGWKDIIGNYFFERENDSYQVLMNNGSGGFLPSVSRCAGGGTFAVASADVDGDGSPDIVTAGSWSMEVTVHKNLGNGSFAEPPNYSSTNALVGALDAADIDGDGDLDIVSSASSLTAIGVAVTVLKNNGDGSFVAGVPYSIRNGGVRAKFRDLNGDGRPDLIFATAISSPPYDFHTAINNGNGTFGARLTWPVNACGWSDIDAVDMDNDGDLDAVLTERLGCVDDPLSARRIFISYNNGVGSFSVPLIKLVNPGPAALATGDFNEDGNIDLVTGHFNSIDIHLGTGTGNILAPVSHAIENSPFALVVNDFNNDGHLDIAACTETNFEGMSVLAGIGDGNFQPARNYFGAYSPDLRNESGITSGDIDEDGDIDIMVSNSASNELSVYLNDGTGNFIFRSRLGLYYSAASPIFAEFTGDCKPDVIAAVQIPFHLFDGGAITILKSSGCIVPLDLLELKATAMHTAVHVFWKTANEINMERYDVEKSTDGIHFTKIGQVVSQNSVPPANYFFLDSRPAKGNNFYRLHMIQTGGSKYSKVVQVDFSMPAESILVFPNPVTNGNAFIQLNNMAPGNYEMTIYNSSGQTVFAKTLFYDGASGSNNIPIQLSLVTGTYIARLRSSKMEKHQLIVIR